MTVKADIEFTKDLFDAANKMRGSIAPSEYKHIVLPLIFLRYLSLRYDKRKEELQKMVNDPSSQWYVKEKELQYEILSDPDQYICEHVYLVPEEAQWTYIVKNAKQSNIKEILDNAMKVLEEQNPELEGVLPRIYQATNLPAENIAGLIEVFSRDVFSGHNGDSVDTLGRVYEYFIGNFASTEGNRGGEFFTPSSIVKLLVAMLEPESGTVFDPACGSGGMFIQSEEYTKNKHSLSFYGQENVETTVRLGKMNVLLHGINADIRLGNSLLGDKFQDLKADFVISNPPFNMKDWGADRLPKNDPRLVGPVTNSNANYMWIQHFLYHLKEGGTAGFVMANGAMTTNTTGEKEVREKLIDESYIDCIVQMPDKLFLTTGIPCTLFFLSRNRNGEKGFRKRNNEILFIDARKKGSLISRKQKLLLQEDIDAISEVYHAFRRHDGKYEDIPGFCKVATRTEVENKNYKLTPGIYVGTQLEDAEAIPYEEKLLELTSILREQFAESNNLQKKILKDLEGLI